MTHKESQLLFDFLSKSSEEKIKKPVLKGQTRQDKKKWTITHDKLNIIAIFFVIILAVVFATGIETGKRSIGHRLEVSRPTPKEVPVPVKDQPIPKAVTTDTANIPTQLASVEKESPLKEVKKEDPKKISTIKASEKPPVKVSAGKGSNYTIQLVTHVNENVAKKEMLALKNKGYKPFVIPSGKYIQVCVGSYTEKEDAVRSIKKFKNIYGDCFVRRR